MRRIVQIEALAGLVSFFQEISPDGKVGLRAVPRAAARCAENLDKPLKIGKVIAIFASKIYHNSPSFARLLFNFFSEFSGVSRFFALGQQHAVFVRHALQRNDQNCVQNHRERKAHKAGKLP